MIRFVTAGEVLPIRNEVLREGRLTLNECRFPSDHLDGAFHLGYYTAGVLVCIASFHPQTYGSLAGSGYQLRGMATLPRHRGMGYGNRLVNFAITSLRGRHVNYIWCNAREMALQFYKGVGFEVISPIFDVPGIGPHYVMYVKIQ